MNLNQVTVSVRNVAEAVEFYRKLGLVQIVDSPHYARFECPDGSATFSVHLAETIAENSGTVIYFECGDLDAKVAELEKLGIEFDSKPTMKSWLWREARLKDPSGNRICLFYAGENRKNPPWRIL